MSDEVTRQMREARQEGFEEFCRAFENLRKIDSVINKKPEPTLTERINEHCRLVAMAEESVKSPVGMNFDPQLAINEFRACKQDPAFSAWATKWAVRLCRALGAE